MYLIEVTNCNASYIASEVHLAGSVAITSLMDTKLNQYIAFYAVKQLVDGDVGDTFSHKVFLCPLDRVKSIKRLEPTPSPTTYKVDNETYFESDDITDEYKD